MRKVLGVMLLVVGASAVAMASPPPAPEIGAGSAGSAVALISGALLINPRPPQELEFQR
jgi:hypothetical protein